MHEAELGVDRDGWHRVEHLHELLVQDAFSLPVGDVVFRFGAVHTVRLGVKEGEAVFILAGLVAHLERFPALHRVSSVRIPGVPGGFEPSTGICRIEQGKRQPSSVLRQVARFV